METAIITSKGQMVIPSKIRNRYGIKNGTKVHIIEEEEGIRIIPITHETIERNKGMFKTGGKLLKALMEEKKKEREL
ncbi:MAG: AbrB/MazE/SpoVT family DNA-binding domain-containing protein [Ignavibacteriales bacterium]|nr:AbrB/MazE/SpoVT family DNA-binding domain-containing protein [Ignavibacteriales bacterium]